MDTYYYVTNSNSAPMFSDTSNGFITIETPMKALKKVVKEYKHPCGLFAAVVYECSPKQKMLARYLSARANTLDGVTGRVFCEGNKITVDDKRLKLKRSKYEVM